MEKKKRGKPNTFFAGNWSLINKSKIMVGHLLTKEFGADGHEFGAHAVK
jgi:hypothetical protein